MKGGSDAWDQGPASAILLEDYFDAASGTISATLTSAGVATFSALGANAAGGTPTPLVYGSYLWASAPFSSTITFTGMTIGAAAADRWVIAAMHLEHADTNIVSAVTIGGVAATRLYGALTLSGDGIRFEFWAANVPTGTTATVVATTPGTFYEGSCATYYCIGEPTFHDGDSDIVYTGTTFSVAIDVPEGGAVIAAVSNENAGVLSSWVGVTADATDETEQTYFASEDQLAVETGRTVSFTSTATSTATRFFGLGVVSVAIPPTGGGAPEVPATLTSAGSGAASFLAQAIVQATASVAAVAATSITSRAVFQSTLTAAAAGSTALTSASVLQATLTSAGAATVSAFSQAVVGGTTTIAGVASTSLSAQARAQATLAAAGAATPSLQANAIAQSTFSASGIGSLAALSPTGSTIDATFSIGGVATTTLQGAGVFQSTLTVAAAAALAAQARAIAQGTMTAAGVAALSGQARALAQSTLTLAGIAALSAQAQAITQATMTANGVASTSFPVNVLAQSTLVVAGVATPTLLAGAIRAATFTSAGVAATSLQAQLVQAAVLSAAGLSTPSMLSGAIAAVTFSIDGVGDFLPLSPASAVQASTLQVSALAVTAFQAAYAGRMRIRLAGTWQQKPLKQWNGSAWVDVPVKLYDGTVWKVI